MNPDVQSSTAPIRTDSPFQIAVVACFTVVFSYLAARVAGYFVIRPEMIWPVWPGCAFLVAMLLLVPRKIWPIILVAGLAGFALYDIQLEVPLRPTLLLLAGDSIEILVAVLGVRYIFGGAPKLNSVKALAKYSLFAIFLAPIPVASLAVYALKGYTWWNGFLTEALALLTITPAILGWTDITLARAKKPKAGYLEALFLCIPLLTFAYFAFLSSDSESRPAFLYAIVPCLLWAAFRLGVTGTSSSIVIVAFLAVMGAVHGRGPFIGNTPQHNVLSLQLFLLVAGASFMVLAALVEQYRSAEESVRESEKRFRVVADSAPVLIWMSGTDKLCTYFNKPWLDFTGRAIEQELGNGWAEGVHPDDFQRCLDTYAASFEKRADFQMEYRLRRHDGEYRWISDIGVPRYTPEGSFAGYIGSCIDVTDRKQNEEARFRHAAIVESSEDAIISQNLDGTITSWNASAEHVFGYKESQAIGQPITMLIPPELRDGENKILERVKAGKRVEHYETIRVTKSGTKFDVSLSISPIKDSAGRVVGFSKIARDVTERKRAAEALLKSEERFRLATLAGKMFAYEWEAATDVIARSADFAKVLGGDEPVETTGQQILARIHPDDRERVVTAVAALTPENPNLQISYRMVRGDGTFIWVERESRAQFDGQGRMLRITGMVKDVTERKKTEEALLVSEERLRLALQAAGIGVFERNLQTGISQWSPEMENIFGIPPGEAPQTTEELMQLVYPEDREPVRRLIDESIETGTGGGEWRVLWPDGSVHWVAGRWRVFKDSEGRPLRALGVDMDITKRKSAEEALRVSEERLRLAQWAAHIGTFDLNIRTGADIWQPETEALYGLPPGGFGGTLTSFENLIHPEDRQRIVELTQEMIRTGQPGEAEWRAVWPDGSIHWIAGRSQVFMDESGKPLRMLGVNMDITERKRAEQELSGMTRKLVEAQEQERARIARDLHDDINQRLALLAIELEQLQHHFPEAQSRTQELHKTTLGISYDVQALSHDLHSSKLEYLGVVPGIKSWCKEYGGRRGVEIDFRSDLSAPVPPELGISLLRVLQEALQNAVKHSGVRKVGVQLREDHGEIHLVIRDSGRGFSIETALQGKGLGLTSMRERVRLWGGTMSIESKPLSGTTIHVRVPLGSEKISQRAVS